MVVAPSESPAVRMVPIYRPSINAYLGAVTPLLDLLLGAAMAGPTKGLQGTEPEAVGITAVRFDVVSNSCCNDQAFLEVRDAEEDDHEVDASHASSTGQSPYQRS